MTNEDAVKRESVLNTLDAMDEALDEDRTVEHYKGLLAECYKALPRATPKPRTGMWLKTGQSYINPSKFRNYCCSECGWELDEHIRTEPHYCQNCGAKMKVEEG